MTLDQRIRAALYDRLLARSEDGGLATRRAQLLAQARGSVLEIGAGTGLNLRHYPPKTDVTLTEPDAAMRAKLQYRARHLQRPVEVVDAHVEQLPFANGSFDTVVSTFVLCSVKRPAPALAEIRRVLKPDGTLLVLEHVRSSNRRIRRRQDALHRPWRALSGGCNCNRATADALADAGFCVSELARGEIPNAPAFLRPLAFGAVRHDG